MIQVLGQGTVEGVGVGAAGTIVLAVVAMLIKRGVTGTFCIGSNGKRVNTSPSNPEYVTRSQCEKTHQNFAAQQKELQILRDAQIQDRHEQTLGAIGKIEKSIDGLHQRIDELLKLGRKN